MRKLDYPERHYLNFALGWLEFGNPIEAKAAADNISRLNSLHPEVFLVRWRIHVRLGNWEEARDLARTFARVFPNRPSGWLCLSYSLYKLKRPLEAYLQLLHQTAVFPSVSAIPYYGENSDYQGYALKLLTKPYRSPSARYAQLIEDIRNDFVRIDQPKPGDHADDFSTNR